MNVKYERQTEEILQCCTIQQHWMTAHELYFSRAAKGVKELFGVPIQTGLVAQMDIKLPPIVSCVSNPPLLAKFGDKPL